MGKFCVYVTYTSTKLFKKIELMKYIAILQRWCVIGCVLQFIEI